MSEQMQTFDGLIQEQKDDIAALQELLELESSAIASRKSADIEAYAKQKLTLVQAIHLRDAKLARCPELQSPSDSTLATVNALKKQLADCQDINDRNGQLLQRAQLSMHKLRNLFQEAAGKNELTYDSDGQASGSRTLGTNVKA